MSLFFNMLINLVSWVVLEYNFFNRILRKLKGKYFKDNKKYARTQKGALIDVFKNSFQEQWGNWSLRGQYAIASPRTSIKSTLQISKRIFTNKSF